jgi:predicted metal-dependent phosphoesterase TrpH
MKADLHIHTTESDGTWNPRQIGSEAQKRGLDIIAVTDHDTVSGVIPAQEAAPPGVELIPGIEISTSIGHRDEVHILGYWIDPQSPALLEYIKRMHTIRVDRAQQIVSRLNQNGINITFADVLKFTPREIVSRSHIAAAMLHEGYVQTKAQAFDQWIGTGKPAYVPRPKMLPEEAVELILAAGGVPVLAHPGLINDQSIIPKIARHKLVGMEVIHSSHSESQTKYYAELANELKLLPSGGSDCHGPGGKDSLFLGKFTIPGSWVESLRQMRQ